MTDPRNIAHDKKVLQEKKKHHDEIVSNTEHEPQPGQKPKMQHPVVKPATDDADESPTPKT